MHGTKTAALKERIRDDKKRQEEAANSPSEAVPLKEPLPAHIVEYVHRAGLARLRLQTPALMQLVRRLRYLAGVLPAGQRVLLVSHFVNIADLTGQTTASGEILVARRSSDGTLAVTGRFVIAP